MATSGRIAICAVFKDESPYLGEWIVYHRLLGVDYFVLYDNASTDNGRETVLRSSLRDSISIVDWPERPAQLTAYQHFIEHHALEFEWVAFIDVDEFIHPLRDGSLPELLTRAGAHPAMLLQWMNFGPSGHRTKPPGLVLEEYTLRLPVDSSVHHHVKSIIRSSALIKIGGSHIAQLRGDPCDADGMTIKNEAIQPTSPSQTAVLNHYYTKSWDDWCKKVRQGRPSVPDDPTSQRKLSWFDEYEKLATVVDTRISRFVPAVKAALTGLSQNVPALEPVVRPTDDRTLRHRPMKWYFALSGTSLSSDAIYANCIRVAVRSAIQNTTLIPVFLFDGERNDLIRELEDCGVTIVYHRSRLYQTILTTFPENRHWQRIASGAYLRVDVPLIETNDEYVLYTDCDVLFLKDPSLQYLRPSHFAVAPEFEHGNYLNFNTGVMIINVAGMRAVDREFIDFIKSKIAGFSAFDQGAFRAFFPKQYDFLPETLNWKPYWGLNPSAEIVHFHGVKPQQAKQLIANLGESYPQVLRNLFVKDPNAYESLVQLWDSVLRTQLADTAARQIGIM